MAVLGVCGKKEDINSRFFLLFRSSLFFVAYTPTPSSLAFPNTIDDYRCSPARTR
jgi:hypothetical protein